MPTNSVGKEEMRGEGRERATVPLSFGSGDVSYTPKPLRTTGGTFPISIAFEGQVEGRC